MKSGKIVSLVVSAVLLCGLSGTAQAADADSADAGHALMVAGLFSKKDHCYEVFVKEFKGKKSRGKVWAKDCAEAKDAVGLDVVLKMGASCTKLKDKQCN